MEAQPLTSSLGARVEGVDLASVDRGAAEAIRSALHEHGVLAFPAQELTREEQVAFTAQLGAVHGHPVPEYLFGAADPVSVVENDGEKLPQDDQHFHVDYSVQPGDPGSRGVACRGGAPGRRRHHVVECRRRPRRVVAGDARLPRALTARARGG